MSLLTQYLQGQADLGVDEIFFDEVPGVFPTVVAATNKGHSDRAREAVGPQGATIPEKSSSSGSVAPPGLDRAAVRPPGSGQPQPLSLSQVLAGLQQKEVSGSPAGASTKISGSKGSKADLPAFARLDDLLQHELQQPCYQGLSPKVRPAGPAYTVVGLLRLGPGPEDESAGRLFGGREGELLDRMLAAIQMRREDLYLSSLLRCGGIEGKVSRRDVYGHLPYLEQELRLQGVKLLLVFGEKCGQALYRTSKSLGEIRTRPVAWGECECIVTHAMEDLLADKPGAKREAWQDLLALQQRLKTVNAAT